MSDEAGTCDAPASEGVRQYADLSPDGDVIWVCDCVVCERCGHHTGNRHQGHYWAYCKVTRTIRAFHFCCPDRCELQSGAQESASETA